MQDPEHLPSQTVRRTGIVATAGLVVALVIAGWVWVLAVRSGGNSNLVDHKLLASLKQQSNTDPTMDPVHLAAGLIPPTNRWFSGLVFGTTPQPVFPLPLAFKPTDSGFSFNLPPINASANTIAGPYTGSITVHINGSSNYKVTRYDAVSIDLTYYNSYGQKLGKLTIAEGSPFIFYETYRPQALTVSGPVFNSQTRNLWAATDNKGYQYGLTANQGTAFSDQHVTAGAQSQLTFFGVPHGMTVTRMAAYATTRLSAVRTAYQVPGQASTTLTYQTDGNRPTLFAAMPGKVITGAATTSAYYDSVYGRLPVYAGNRFSYAVNQVQPQTALDLSRLSGADRTLLTGQLQKDAAATHLTATDSYNGGKELYRAANLYTIAFQLHQQSIANNLQQKLEADFNDWLDPTGYQQRANRYFYYDTELRGLVAVTPDYGSEDFNDHHFHYGYYLYAAAVLAQHDKGFVKQHEAFVNLLASDIANPTANKYFPVRRTYDPYAGHSWASGNGTFGDGNNQESSSEAVNAWNGVAAWAAVTNDKVLENEAVWMLSNEVASASAYWLNPNVSSPLFKGYTHTFVALNWGGKRDFATFFSSAPTALLGIQLIPMSPVMQVLAQEDQAHISANLSSVGNTDSASLGDYLLMYRALEGGAKTNLVQQAQQLSAQYIDNADSRTYLLAWVMSARGS